MTTTVYRVIATKPQTGCPNLIVESTDRKRAQKVLNDLEPILRKQGFTDFAIESATKSEK